MVRCLLVLLALGVTVGARAQPQHATCRHLVGALAHDDPAAANRAVGGGVSAQTFRNFLRAVASFTSGAPLLVRERVPASETEGFLVERWHFDFGWVLYAGCVATPAAAGSTPFADVQLDTSLPRMIQKLREARAGHVAPPPRPAGPPEESRG